MFTPPLTVVPKARSSLLAIANRCASNAIVTVILIVSSAWSMASSPVWKVSKGNSHIYLGGTFHLLAKSDHPLPSEFEQAYKKSSEIVFETDLAALESPQFLPKIMQAMTFTDGSTLEQSLRPRVYAALKEYLAMRNIPEVNFARLTPTGASLSIQIMEYQLLGMHKEAGVDAVYTRKAKKDGKKIGQLETPDEQLAFISSMGLGKENEMVMQTLKEIGSLSEQIDTLKIAWRKGDNALLAQKAIDDMQKDFPNMYETLLTKRNKMWMPKIEKMFEDEAIEFVLVGAMHLAGDDGLLKDLKSKGYFIENL